MNDIGCTFRVSGGFKLLRGLLAPGLLLGLPLLASADPWIFPGSGAWPPPSAYGTLPGSYQTSGQASIPMDATVSETPPSITLRIFATGTYKIYRKAPFSLTWGTEVATASGATAPFTWTDTNVAVGGMYEYGIGRVASTYPDLAGNVLAGIKADRTQPNGRIVLVVADDVPAHLPAEYARYKDDLELEGWVVHEILVPRAPDYTGNGTGANDANGIPTAPFPDAPMQIRNQIIALHQQYPGELKTVAILGKVPVARTGTGYLGPDGHGYRDAVAADAYYADMDGVWPDTTNNLSEYPVSNPSHNQAKRSDAVADGRVNVAGDNKFNPTFLWQLGASSPNQDLELGFGRIDFSNDVPAEFEAMRLYFDKLHRYKISSPDFQPGRRANNRWSSQPGDFSWEIPNAFWRAIPGVVGMENIRLTNASDLRGGQADDDSYDGASDFLKPDLDSLYSRENGPFLFYFKGSGVPRQAEGGKAVFWSGLQSHYGYWFLPRGFAMQRFLSQDNYALSYTWAVGADYLYHRMAMGLDISDVMRSSLTRRYHSSTPSLSIYIRPPVAAHMSSRCGLNMSHMGCPSLRLFPFAPPSNLSIVPAGSHAQLSWTASPEVGVVGYHVYRSAEKGGPYTRLTAEPVPGATYADESVSSGNWHYMVRAVRLETTGGGTYWNASIGVRQSLSLDGPAPALTVAGSNPPDARWGDAYSHALEADGGMPQFSWELFSGMLPPGLSLSANGKITGVPTKEGHWNFTVRVTDQVGVQAEKALHLAVLSDSAQVVFADASASFSAADGYKVPSSAPAMRVSGPVYNYSSYVRFDLSALNFNNSFVRARLVLFADKGTPSSTLAQVQAALLAPSPNWTAASVAFEDCPPDDTGVRPAIASTRAAAEEFIEFDVTELIRRSLETDAAHKPGFRIFTNTALSFGDEIRLAPYYSSGNARPRLIIETSDAPRIEFLTPAVNPAVIAMGTALQVRAAVIPVPARSGAETVQWEQVSGPSPAVVASPTAKETTVTFPAVGYYTLRLKAGDGVLSSSRDLQVRVLEVPAQTAAAYGPTAGLILRLALDENAGTTAADVAPGTAANGTLATIDAGGALPVWVPQGGKIGGALLFNGTKQRVEVPDSAGKPLDGMSQMSLSAWIKMDSHAGLSTAILVKRTSNTASSSSYALTLTSSRRLAASIGTAGINSTSIRQLEVGKWYHVVMVFDGADPVSNLRLYLDGLPELFGKVAATTLARRSTTPLRVGDFTTVTPSSTASFNGLIDEVRVYDRALTQEEILDLHRAAPANMGPQIALGGDVSGEAGVPMELNASVTDDGLPGPLSVQWVKAAGPGAVAFADPAQAVTTATAGAAGEYSLRLFASDGEVTTWKDLVAVVTGSSMNPGYAAWLLANGLPVDGSGLGAPAASAGGDGVANAVKYALGLSKDAVRYAGRMKVGIEEMGGLEYLTLTYVIPEPALSGVVCRVKTGADLENWSEDVTERASTVEGGLRTITVRDNQPFGQGHPKRFIRLEVGLE